MMTAAVAAGVLAAGVASASGPLPVIAVVDKVVLLPDTTTPTGVQVWGTFVRQEGNDSLEYGMPHYGYYHYTAVSGKEEACRRDWTKMQKSAGTGKVIGWGNGDDPRHAGVLHNSQEKPGKADPYPLAYGVLDFNADSSFEPVRRLMTIPAPVSPPDGGEVSARKVPLVVRNVRDRATGWRYVFTLECEGVVEKSEPLEAGKDETSWTPKMEIKPGQNYLWHIQASTNKKDPPKISSSFTGK
jgi:hypothetical protein